MRERFEYVLDLRRWHGSLGPAVLAGLSLRSPETGDLHALAELMLEAYRGTIDYEGETITEAVDEVRRYLDPRALDQARLEPSVLLTSGTTLVSACLVAYCSRRSCPFISYVITHPSWKRRGFATRLVAESLSRFAKDGHDEVRTVITKGNIPSESLFLRLGFKVRAG